jgi:hypothetical protein
VTKKLGDDFVFGKPSKMRLRTVEELIKGKYSVSESSANDDVGKCMKPGYRNISNSITGVRKRISLFLNCMFIIFTPRISHMVVQVRS